MQVQRVRTHLPVISALPIRRIQKTHTPEHGWSVQGSSVAAQIAGSPAVIVRIQSSLTC